MWWLDITLRKPAGIKERAQFFTPCLSLVIGNNPFGHLRRHYTARLFCQHQFIYQWTLKYTPRKAAVELKQRTHWLETCWLSALGGFGQFQNVIPRIWHQNHQQMLRESCNPVVQVNLKLPTGLFRPPHQCFTLVALMQVTSSPTGLSTEFSHIQKVCLVTFRLNKLHLQHECTTFHAWLISSLGRWKMQKL